MKRPWFVKQRDKSDCGVCCLAMLTGRRYEDVLQTIGDAYSPEDGMTNTALALTRLGFEPEVDLPVRRSFKLFDVEPGATLDPHVVYGRRMLLSVPSRTREGWHMVYWTGQVVLDPSGDHRNVYELEPRMIVIFRETFHM